MKIHSEMIKRTLLSVIIETLSSNSIDQINNKFSERKRDLITSDFTIKKLSLIDLLKNSLKK